MTVCFKRSRVGCGSVLSPESIRQKRVSEPNEEKPFAMLLQTRMRASPSPLQLKVEPHHREGDIGDMARV